MAWEKIIIGIVLILIGLYLLLPLGLWRELYSVLQGIIPIFLIFIGAILVWVESEELKIEKSVSKPAPKTSAPKKRKR